MQLVDIESKSDMELPIRSKKTRSRILIFAYLGIIIHACTFSSYLFHLDVFGYSLLANVLFTCLMVVGSLLSSLPSLSNKQFIHGVVQLVIGFSFLFYKEIGLPLLILIGMVFFHVNLFTLFSYKTN